MKVKTFSELVRDELRGICTYGSSFFLNFFCIISYSI